MDQDQMFWAYYIYKIYPLSFSARPSYAQIAEWRKILQRLAYFLRLVDYQLLELLRRLVVTATSCLSKFVLQSYQNGPVLQEEEDMVCDVNYWKYDVQ